MNLPPLRDINDFLFGSARFQLPNYRDQDKWANRVSQNLMYYQTNYFLTGICLILVLSILNPLKIIYGSFGFVILLGVFAYYHQPSRSASTFRKDYPFVGLILALLSLFSTYYLFSCILIFIFALLLPVTFAFLHASLRLRNLKNKLSTIEREISGMTPMGSLLQIFGMEPELFS